MPLDRQVRTAGDTVGETHKTQHTHTHPARLTVLLSDRRDLLAAHASVCPHEALRPLLSDLLRRIAELEAHDKVSGAFARCKRLM